MAFVITGMIAVFLFILGICMKNGKGLMLLAGYNTMPKEERDKIDKKKLSKTAGNLMIWLSLIFTLLCVAIYFEMTPAAYALIIATIVISCISSAKMLRISSEPATYKRKTIVAVVTSIIVLIAVCFLFYYGEKEPEVSILDDDVKIEAMYGLEVSFSDIAEISIIDKSMKDIGIGRRNNGYGGFGATLKGHFNSERLGKHLLFVNSGSAPTILIERKGQENIYISFGDSEKTKLLYQELKSGLLSLKISYAGTWRFVFLIHNKIIGQVYPLARLLPI